MKEASVHLGSNFVELFCGRIFITLGFFCSYCSRWKLFCLFCFWKRKKLDGKWKYWIGGLYVKCARIPLLYLKTKLREGEQVWWAPTVLEALLYYWSRPPIALWDRLLMRYIIKKTRHCGLRTVMILLSTFYSDDIGLQTNLLPKVAQLGIW